MEFGGRECISTLTEILRTNGWFGAGVAAPKLFVGKDETDNARLTETFFDAMAPKI
jgi:hypothetical protein